MKSDKDFYQTNPKMVEVLIMHFISKLSRLTILDPCCGKCVIGKGFFKNDIRIDEFDFFPVSKMIEKADFLSYGNTNNYYKAVVMNPPYSQKYAFLDHALNHFENVYCLLPEISLNYNIINEKYLSMPRYWGKIKMYPKMFLHEGIEDKFGGTTCYSWLCFDGDIHGKFKHEIIHNLLGDKQ
jgi:hypothetical protein